MDNDPDGNIQSMAWPMCVSRAPGFMGSWAAVDMELLIEFFDNAPPWRRDRNETRAPGAM